MRVCVCSELETVVEPWVDRVKLAMDVLDLLCLVLYITEIVLKWIDSCADFWRAPWNIFDFVVTFAVRNKWHSFRGGPSPASGSRDSFKLQWFP